MVGKCPLWVKQPGQLSLPSLQRREMYSDSCSCNYIDHMVQTIKQQTWAAYGCLVAGESPLATVLASIGCTPALSVTQRRRCSCSCRLWRYISDNAATNLYRLMTEARVCEQIVQGGTLQTTMPPSHIINWKLRKYGIS